MAAPINSPLTGDIWHLCIDDLLAPLPEKARLGGPGPFVINLSASTAPIDLPADGIAGCRHAHVYQLQRTEDRRPRYRLRLGPFASEDEADAILGKVRDTYPGALTATADADDLRSIASIQAKAAAAAPPPAPPTLVLAVPPAAPSIAAMPSTAVPPSHSATPSTAATPAIPVLSTDAAVSPQRTPPKPLAAKPPVSRSPKPVPKAPAAAVAPVAVVAPAAAVAPASFERKVPRETERKIQRETDRKEHREIERKAHRERAAVPSPVEQVSMVELGLETTQTVRALTTLELEDDTSTRWFAIQLSLSEEAFDSETVPNLDIFSVYRLYCVAGIDQGRIMHALRLGFFSEEMAAGAVASYLADYYDNPTVKRVSAAERDRFADEGFEPRKDIGATGRHAVIEITDERFVRERRSTPRTGPFDGAGSAADRRGVRNTR
jgi:hypothetical protein